MNKNSLGKLIIVSNRLPFQLVKHGSEHEIRESDGGLVSALRSYFEKASDQYTFESVQWIGSAEFTEKNWEKLKAKNTIDLSYMVDPLFIETKLYNSYYNGFCNATLWPLFHYFPSYVEFNNQTFQSYEAVNQLFADAILAHASPGDVIWIHDYQLMLVPDMIRKKRPDVTIGFFLHIPFPSFEMFRLLHRPWKEKIIAGLLGADLVGFHTHEYVQNFLKTIQMVKGYDHRFRQIFLSNRIVKTEMFPLGIDFDKFHEAIELDEVLVQKEIIRENFTNKKIVFSVDRLDYTKGITHRLSGFEFFLQQHPEWHGKIVFILVVVPSRQIVLKYKERKRMIEEEIGRINGKYSTLGWQPVVYRYTQLSFHELIAMYHVADIGLITPLRDGMNLVAKEYVASRRDQGVLILSELAGAASELSEAILVNPRDREEVSAAILEALTMSPEMQRTKLELSQQRLREYTVSHWMNDFLRQLEETKTDQLALEAKQISGAVEKLMLKHYVESKKRLVLLDYDGTLVPFSKHPALAIPEKNVLDILTALASVPNTDLTIISGRDRESLAKWFEDLPVHIISEHGAEIRLKSEDWKMNMEIDQSWKTVIRPMLELFSQRSPGSFVEEKKYTLVWHYRNVEKGLAFTRSRELLDNLYHIVRNTPLNIIDGNKVIEIRMAGIDKGSIARQLAEQGDYDFILAIGDDKTDEDMFRVLGNTAYTIKVGTGQTVARYSINSQSEVLPVLEKMLNTVNEKTDV